MMLARVIGTVVATVKYPTLEGRKLLLIQPVTRTGVPRGKPLVAIDAVGAGESETVYWCRGKEASLAFDSEVVSDASIVGIVDEITCGPGLRPGDSGQRPEPHMPAAATKSNSKPQSRPAPARGRR